MGSAKVPTGLSCAELFYGSHSGLLGHAAGGCEWGTTHSAPVVSHSRHSIVELAIGTVRHHADD
jgi:hypothetical protein